MIPTKLRAFCIIQLCIGFTLLLAMLLSPGLKATYSDKRKLLLIESALGDVQGAAFKLATENERRVLERNYVLSLSLPKGERDQLIKMRDVLVKRQEERSMKGLIQEALIGLFENPYTLLYILFSIAAPLMILLRHQAGMGMVLFLPLLTAFFAIDNLAFAPPKRNSPEEKLFPTESALKETFDRKKQGENRSFEIKEALDLWLIDNFLKTNPSEDPEVLALQKEEASYRFLTLRALALKAGNKPDGGDERLGLMTLALYFFWNSFFALNCFRSLKRTHTVKER